MVGRIDLGVLLMSCCAGDEDPLIGVLMYLRRPRYGSALESTVFCMILFAMSTAFSMCPFDFGKFGLDVQSCMSYSCRNVMNSLDENCGPLFDQIFKGMPYLAKWDLSLVMITNEVLQFSLSISLRNGYSNC